MEQNPVFESTKYVVQHADNVFLDQDAINLYARNFEVPEHNNWMRDSFDLTDLSEEEQAMLCTVFNSGSFSYWGEPYWSVEWNGKSYNRASWSMVAAILRSKEEGMSLLDPETLANLNEENLAHALRGNTKIPMLKERLDILTLVGRNILEKGKGSILNIVQEAKEDALKLVELILKDFSPAFDDHYEYKGETIQFNKRSQALVESLHSIFSGKGHGSFKNIDQLSALADYIIPNLLHNKGMLRYSDELANLIDTKQELQKGGAYEIEIRAGTVWAIEGIREELIRLRGEKVSRAAINDSLWIKGGDITTPFHLVRTTAY